MPLSDGRSIEIPFGDVLNKVLEVGRGTEYDYDNLALVLRSQCDDNITDTVYLSAHFIPSSSDINIKSPTDKWTLNTNSPLDSITGKYYMFTRLEESNSPKHFEVMKHIISYIILIAASTLLWSCVKSDDENCPTPVKVEEPTWTVDLSGTESAPTTCISKPY